MRDGTQHICNEPEGGEGKSFQVTMHHNIMPCPNCGVTIGIIDSFMGEYRWLSNYHIHIHPILLEDGTYMSVEHAFQAAKTYDKSERKLIELAKRCKDAKAFGQKVKLRSDWEQVKDQVMYECVLDKFTKNVDIAARLRATGDCYLIEGNTWNDTYWGVCRGMGKNKLGETLMRVRGEIS